MSLELENNKSITDLEIIKQTFDLLGVTYTEESMNGNTYIYLRNQNSMLFTTEGSYIELVQ